MRRVVIGAGAQVQTVDMLDQVSGANGIGQVGQKDGFCVPPLTGTSFETFRKVFPAYWPFMRDAQVDLSARLEDWEMPIQTAFALVLHEEIEAGEKAIERDREKLRGYGLLDCQSS